MKLSREQLTRQAVLMAFCDPLPPQCSRLRRLTAEEWRRLLRWLDTSGLALYFLDRLTELRLTRIVPPGVLARLEQNLADNTGRMRSLLAESISIHGEFQRAGLSYALLKGFSLWPHSVPHPELRSQLDLDFLVAEEDILHAQSIVEQRGYRLRAVSGRSWEFKTGHIPSGSLDSLYKSVPHRCIELHTGPDPRTAHALLASAETRVIDGAAVPVLAPVDLFLGQALHLFKHVCSECFRAAHLLELHRHVLARSSDRAFWARVRAKAEPDPQTRLALGIVTLLITEAIGGYAPEALSEWTVRQLPTNVRLWIDHYGSRAALAQFPGSKLYLLLQHELDSAGVPARRSLRRALLPLRLPPAVAPATGNETARTRLLRYRMQIRFLSLRLRFHFVEGLLYLWERLRWQRICASAARAASTAALQSPGATAQAPLPAHNNRMTIC